MSNYQWDNIHRMWLGAEDENGEPVPDLRCDRHMGHEFPRVKVREEGKVVPGAEFHQLFALSAAALSVKTLAEVIDAAKRALQRGLVEKDQKEQMRDLIDSANEAIRGIREVMGED